MPASQPHLEVSDDRSNISVLLSLLLSSVALAQPMDADPSFDLHRWLSIRAGVQFNAAPGAPTGVGMGAVVEPMFRATEQLSVGLRVDATALFAVGVSDASASVGIGIPVATLLKGEYAFAPAGTGPFVGLATGSYLLTSLGGSGGSGSAAAGFGVGRFFGLAPQLGLDLGGFRIAAAYHLIFTPENASGSYGALELSWKIF